MIAAILASELAKPILVGRSAAKLRRLAEGVAKSELGRSIEWSTDIKEVLANPEIDIAFDAASTQARPDVLRIESPVDCGGGATGRGSGLHWVERSRDLFPRALGARSTNFPQRNS